MKFHWSKENCGDPLFLITAYDLTLKLKDDWEWEEEIRFSHNDELPWKCDLCGYRGNVYWFEIVRKRYGK